MSLTRNVVLSAAAGLAVATGICLGTAAQAQAQAQAATIYEIDYFSNFGDLRGAGYFSDDPHDGYPGDAIMSCDLMADGFGIRTELDVSPDLHPGDAFHADRAVSTVGHSVDSEGGYCTGWKTGGIAEESWVAMRVCKVKGSRKWCGHVEWYRA